MPALVVLNRRFLIASRPLETRARRAVPWLLGLHVIASTVEVVVSSYGAYLLLTHVELCAHWSPRSLAGALVGASWGLVGFNFLLMLLVLNPWHGLDLVDKHKAWLRGASRLVASQALSEEATNERGSALHRIASLMSGMLQHVDFTLSDLATAMLLVAAAQQMRRRRVLRDAMVAAAAAAQAARAAGTPPPPPPPPPGRLQAGPLGGANMRERLEPVAIKRPDPAPSPFSGGAWEQPQSPAPLSQPGQPAGTWPLSAPVSSAAIARLQLAGRSEPNDASGAGASTCDVSLPLSLDNMLPPSASAAVAAPSRFATTSTDRAAARDVDPALDPALDPVPDPARAVPPAVVELRRMLQLDPVAAEGYLQMLLAELPRHLHSRRQTADGTAGAGDDEPHRKAGEEGSANGKGDAWRQTADGSLVATGEEEEAKASGGSAEASAAGRELYAPGSAATEPSGSTAEAEAPAGSNEALAAQPATAGGQAGQAQAAGAGPGRHQAKVAARLMRSAALNREQLVASARSMVAYPRAWTPPVPPQAQAQAQTQAPDQPMAPRSLSADDVSTQRGPAGPNGAREGPDITSRQLTPMASVVAMRAREHMAAARSEANATLISATSSGLGSPTLPFPPRNANALGPSHCVLRLAISSINGDSQVDEGAEGTTYKPGTEPAGRPNQPDRLVASGAGQGNDGIAGACDTGVGAQEGSATAPPALAAVGPSGLGGDGGAAPSEGPEPGAASEEAPPEVPPSPFMAIQRPLPPFLPLDAAAARPQLQHLPSTATMAARLLPVASSQVPHMPHVPATAAAQAPYWLTSVESMTSIVGPRPPAASAAAPSAAPAAAVPSPPAAAAPPSAGPIHGHGHAPAEVPIPPAVTVLHRMLQLTPGGMEPHLEELAEELAEVEAELLAGEVTEAEAETEADAEATDEDDDDVEEPEEEQEEGVGSSGGRRGGSAAAAAAGFGSVAAAGRSRSGGEGKAKAPKWAPVSGRSGSAAGAAGTGSQRSSASASAAAAVLRQRIADAALAAAFAAERETVDRQTLEEALVYGRYAAAAYGVHDPHSAVGEGGKKGGSWLARWLGPQLSAQDAMQNSAEGYLPYAVCLDEPTRSVVISVRGTASVEDIVTDCLLEPYDVRHLLPPGLLDAAAPGEGAGGNEAPVLVHGGIWGATEAVLTDLERLGLLELLFPAPAPSPPAEADLAASAAPAVAAASSPAAPAPAPANEEEYGLSSLASVRAAAASASARYRGVDWRSLSTRRTHRAPPRAEIGRAPAEGSSRWPGGALEPHPSARSGDGAPTTAAATVAGAGSPPSSWRQLNSGALPTLLSVRPSNAPAAMHPSPSGRAGGAAGGPPAWRRLDSGMPTLVSAELSRSNPGSFRGPGSRSSLDLGPGSSGRATDGGAGGLGRSWRSPSARPSSLMSSTLGPAPRSSSSLGSLGLQALRSLLPGGLLSGETRTSAPKPETAAGAVYVGSNGHAPKDPGTGHATVPAGGSRVSLAAQQSLPRTGGGAGGPQLRQSEPGPHPAARGCAPHSPPRPSRLRRASVCGDDDPGTAAAAVPLLPLENGGESDYEPKANGVASASAPNGASGANSTQPQRPSPPPSPDLASRGHPALQAEARHAPARPSRLRRASVCGDDDPGCTAAGAVPLLPSSVPSENGCCSDHQPRAKGVRRASVCSGEEADGVAWPAPLLPGWRPAAVGGSYGSKDGSLSPVDAAALDQERGTLERLGASTPGLVRQGAARHAPQSPPQLGMRSPPRPSSRLRRASASGDPADAAAFVASGLSGVERASPRAELPSAVEDADAVESEARSEPLASAEKATAGQGGGGAQERAAPAEAERAAEAPARSAAVHSAQAPPPAEARRFSLESAATHIARLLGGNPPCPRGATPSRTGGACSGGRRRLVTLPLPLPMGTGGAKGSGTGSGSGADTGRPWRLVVTGHSLGGGTAALLAMRLRAALPHVEVRAWAFSPPGALASPALSSALAPFCVSVVGGKDIVPRLSPQTMERYRDEMVSALARCSCSKVQVLLASLSSANLMRRAASLLLPYEALPPQAAEALWRYHRGVQAAEHMPELHAPGKILYLQPSAVPVFRQDSTHTRAGGSSSFGLPASPTTPAGSSSRFGSFSISRAASARSQGPGPSYRPVWVSADELSCEGILASDRMIADHSMSGCTLPALQALLKQQEQEQRRSGTDGSGSSAT
ncbi:hypothetical protein HYH03_013334 [Edaphochlamys debaryana]|uniref:sn-1-specific diacylglycerol lipase n=1 Tax=Edaphochlamys debaryana TaxID=47281 RepID=A0A835XPU9_9CHLO|nr:hypothetical protein HYH03_013334 [Edaphochlamys debaryana]|eukprot:KAG2488028.1 hypothetical protein HYH03_013334 [Edaphochlamys debaryana]